MPEITITIPGHPVAKARPRVTSHGTYTPQATQDYHDWIHVHALRTMIGDKPIPRNQEVALGVYVYRKAETTSRPDIDNYVKSIMDGLNGIVWEDDAQVVSLQSGKFRDTNERIEVKVRQL